MKGSKGRERRNNGRKRREKRNNGRKVEKAGIGEGVTEGKRGERGNVMMSKGGG